MSAYETETIDKLFLELSQVTRATTGKELRLAEENVALRARQAVLVEALRDAVASLGGIRSDKVPDSVRDVLSQIAMTQTLDATSAALAQGEG